MSGSVRNADRQGAQSGAKRKRASDAERNMPLIVTLFGDVVLLDGIISLPLLLCEIVRAVSAVVLGYQQVNPLNLTVIMSVIGTVLFTVNSALMIVFGVLLILRKDRHRAAPWTYVLMPLTFIEIMFSLCLHGIGWGLLIAVVRFLLLAALSVTVDPGLREERRLQRTLRRMDERDAFLEDEKDGMLGRDRTGKGYMELNFFNMFWLFAVGCVFGCAVETVYHAVVFGGYQNRASFLYGQFSAIYGFGVILVSVCLNRMYRSSVVTIFLSSAVLGGAFEWVSSWFMEVTVGMKAWDYTGKWLSIGGRTCGQFMFFWGVLGVVWMRLILPALLNCINRIPWKIRYTLTSVCFILLLADALFTLMAIDCWYMRLAGIHSDSPVAQWINLHFPNEVMEQRLPTMHIDPSVAGRP